MTEPSSALTGDQFSWHSVALFSCCVFHDIKNRESLRPLFERPSVGDRPNITVTYSNVVGEGFRWTAYANDVALRSSETQSAVQGYFLQGVELNDFVIVHVVAILHPAFIDQLRKCSDYQASGGHYYDYNRLINALIVDLLPKIDGTQLTTCSDAHAMPHVLSLEPEEMLLSDEIKPNLDDLGSLATRLRNFLGQQTLLQTPVLLEDMLIFPPLGYGNRNAACVAVRTIPFPSKIAIKFSASDLSYVVPLIPISFLNHLAVRTIRDFYARKLNSLPASTAQYWSLGKSWRDLSNYRTKFLEMRLQIDTLSLKAEEDEAAFEETLPRTHLLGQRYTLCRDTVRTDAPAHHKTSMDEIVRRTSSESEMAVRLAITRAKERTYTLDSFIRDSSIADSTNTSVSLARNVERLTWIIVAVGIITLFASLIPDYTKEKLFESLLHGTKLSWLIPASDHTK